MLSFSSKINYNHTTLYHCTKWFYKNQLVNRIWPRLGRGGGRSAPIVFNQGKHRKNCECCPGHYLIVNHYSSMSLFKFRNLSVIVNCVAKSLIHEITLNLNRCLCSHCSHCSHSSLCSIFSNCNDCIHCIHCIHCSHCSHCSHSNAEIKMSLSDSPTDWQCHLLSCPGQLQIKMNCQIEGESVFEIAVFDFYNQQIFQIQFKLLQ